MIKAAALVHGELSSHTVRILEIARELRRTGSFEIVFAGSGPFMGLVEEAGFDWYQTQAVSKGELYRKLDGSVIEAIYDRYNYDHFFQVEDIFLREYQPDLIFRDLFREMAGVSSKQADNRVFDVYVQKAMLSMYYHFDFRPESLPGWFDIFPQGWLMPVAPVLEDYYRKKNSKYIRKKALELGLGEYVSIEGVRPDLALFVDAPELYPLAEADEDKCRHIGPVIYNDRRPEPVWLEDFKNDSRKKVLISMGTTGEHDCDELFEAALGDGEYAVAYHSNTGKMIDGFYGCDQFNTSSIIGYCDVFVTHGGTGNTYMSLREGVPLLVLHDHFEQQANGVELARNGAAINLVKKARQPGNIRMAVEELLTMPEYRESAQKLQNSIDFENSAKRAVDYIINGFESYKKREKGLEIAEISV
jgi:UDP:flavonoid glycosyltransferase YjiC (YdhE family)